MVFVDCTKLLFALSSLAQSLKRMRSIPELFFVILSQRKAPETLSKSKAKDHQQCLKRRLTLWSNGDIQSLLEEGRAIQLRLTMYQNKQKADTARVFANLMFAGKVKAALRLVSNLDMCRTLSPYQLAGEGEDRVIDILKKKHPAAQPLVQSAIIEASDTNFHPVLFDEINGPLIRSVALKTQGSAGPSGLDAAGWKRMCTSYQNDSDQLCEAIARWPSVSVPLVLIRKG